MKSQLRIATLIVSLTLTAGCQSSCPPPVPNDLLATYYPIELGNVRNVLTDAGVSFYLGHRVERFRLKVRFFNPGHPEQWISGVTLSVHANTTVQDILSLPAVHDPDGSFFTQEFTGNLAEIRISSGGNVVDFQGGRPRLEIVAVERHFRAGSAWNDLPPTTLPPAASADHGFVQIGRLNTTEVIGFSPGVGEAQHYRIAPGTTTHTESLYISPRLLASGLNNSTGIKVHISNTGFVTPDDTNVQWIEPALGDSGIYTEFQSNPQQPKFVTVVSTVITPYLIRNTWLVEGFGNIVMERDQPMGAAPNIDLADIRNHTNEDSPFNSQIADYLQASADYDRRIRETLVMASAFALDGSDGQMRFQSAELFRDISFFRNVDVQFSICNDVTNPACRANAGSFHVDMFTGDLNDPIAAGWTFHHEWGHWSYELPDEYVDVVGPGGALTADALDPNSLMGTKDSTEFCTPMNHSLSGSPGLEAESCWTQIADQYPEVDNAPLVVSRLSYARYRDVLHKLDSLLTLTVH